MLYRRGCKAGIVVHCVRPSPHSNYANVKRFSFYSILEVNITKTVFFDYVIDPEQPTYSPEDALRLPPRVSARQLFHCMLSVHDYVIDRDQHTQKCP